MVKIYLKYLEIIQLVSVLFDIFFFYFCNILEFKNIVYVKIKSNFFVKVILFVRFLVFVVIVFSLSIEI